MPNYYIRCDDCYTIIRECTKKEKDHNRYNAERCSRCKEKYDRDELFQKVRKENQMERMKKFIVGLTYCLESDRENRAMSESDIESVLDAFNELIQG